MTFGSGCVCFCENVVIRPIVSLDRPDLTDLGLIVSLVDSDLPGPRGRIASSVSHLRCSPLRIIGSTRPTAIVMLRIVLYYIHRLMLDNT